LSSRMIRKLLPRAPYFLPFVPRPTATDAAAAIWAIWALFLMSEKGIQPFLYIPEKIYKHWIMQ
jgi:hypothetical protein